MTEKIRAALEKLDPKNAENWESDGKPSLKVLRILTGNFTLTAEQVKEAAPDFVRPEIKLEESDQQSPPQENGDAPQGREGELLPQNLSAAQEQQDRSQAIDDEALERAQRRLVRAQEEEAEAKEYVQAASAEVDRILDARTAAGMNETLSDHLAGYFAQQQKQRDMRAARIDALKGVNLGDILPKKSAIDEAMARRTGRGGRRPGQTR